MSFRNISKEAMAGTVTLGVVLLVGYFFGKREEAVFYFKAKQCRRRFRPLGGSGEVFNRYLSRVE